MTELTLGGRGVGPAVARIFLLKGFGAEPVI